jgi:hypothetical protein
MELELGANGMVDIVSFLFLEAQEGSQRRALPQRAYLLFVDS